MGSTMPITTDIEFEAYKKVFMDFAIWSKDLKLMYEIESMNDPDKLIIKMQRKLIMHLDWDRAGVTGYKTGFCKCWGGCAVASHNVNSGDKGVIKIAPFSTGHQKDPNCKAAAMHILLQETELVKWKL